MHLGSARRHKNKVADKEFPGQIFARMVVWWELGYKDGWTLDSVIKFGCEVNTRSIHEEKYSNICVVSLITKPNFDEIFSIALPSIVVMYSYTS